MELVAILLIPTLLKAASEATGETLLEDVAKPPPELLEKMLRRITYDVAGTEDSQPLTAEFLTTMLRKFGEEELAKDAPLIDEMIEKAELSLSGGVLDHEAFARALTSDLRLYNIEGETIFATNEDLILLNNDKNTTKDHPPRSLDISELGHIPPDEREALSSGVKLERVYVIPGIDVTAETYRSRSLMVLLWTTIILTFFA